MATEKRRVYAIPPESLESIGFPVDQITAPQLAACASRYADLVNRASRRLARVIEPGEWELIADALNGCLELTDPGSSGIAPLMLIRAAVEDSIQLDGFDTRWAIDGTALIRKLNKLTDLEGDAIAAAVRYFWANGEEIDIGEDKWWTAEFRASKRE